MPVVLKKKKKKSRFVAFAKSHGVNTSTVVNFKLVTTSVNTELGSEGHRKRAPGHHHPRNNNDHPLCLGTVAGTASVVFRIV